jgi:cytochrome c-type biogenesis protein CcmH/NrfG
MFALHKPNAYRSALIILCACIASLGLGLYLNPDISKAYHFQQDQKALQHAKSILADKNQLTHLIEVLENRVLHHPNDIKAQTLLARIYAGQGNWDKAYSLIAKVYPIYLRDLKTTLFYVEARWHKQGHLDKKGRAILMALLEKNPNQIDSLMMLASDAKSRACDKEAQPYLQRLSILFAGDDKMKTEIDTAILHTKAQNNSACLAPF